MTPAICRAPGCERPAKTRGLCRNHYWKWRDATSPNRCSIEGCPKAARSNGLCQNHYHQAIYRTDAGHRERRKAIADASRKRIRKRVEAAGFPPTGRDPGQVPDVASPNGATGEPRTPSGYRTPPSGSAPSPGASVGHGDQIGGAVG